MGILMPRLLLVLSLAPRLWVVLGFAVILAVSAGARAWAAPAQTLRIDLTAAQPQVDRFNRYIQGQPVDVRVVSRSRRGVALIGVSPTGANLRVPLARAGDGTYGGSFTPGTPGMWSLAVVSETAAANASPSFPVVVAEPGASDATAAAMIALAIASIGGGIGLITVGHRSSTAQI